MSERRTDSKTNWVATSDTPDRRTMVAIDIASFGHPSRDDGVRIHLRTTLYELVSEAFDAAGVPWDRCRHEDRGDGVLIITPRHVAAGLLVDPMLLRLEASIRRHNH